MFSSTYECFYSIEQSKVDNLIRRPPIWTALIINNLGAGFTPA